MGKVLEGKKVIREVALKKFGEVIEVRDDVAPHDREAERLF